jgi:hypothetical protein
MTAKLHCTLLPRACLNETHLPRCEPKQHLVPYPNVKARIQLDVRWQPNEEVYDTETEEWMSRFFSMCRNHAVVAAEIARRDTIHLELELLVKNNAQNAHHHNIFMAHLIYYRWPAACAESRSMSTVSTEEFIRAKPI